MESTKQAKMEKFMKSIILGFGHAPLKMREEALDILINKKAAKVKTERKISVSHGYIENLLVPISFVKRFADLMKEGRKIEVIRDVRQFASTQGLPSGLAESKSLAEEINWQSLADGQS